jgi:hypothetical protein
MVSNWELSYLLMLHNSTKIWDLDENSRWSSWIELRLGLEVVILRGNRIRGLMLCSQGLPNLGEEEDAEEEMAAGLPGRWRRRR